MRYVLLLSLLLSACGPPEEEMPQQVTLKAVGLVTHPNYLDRPDGAFTRADNAVIRREGIAETRRGFKAAAGTFGSSGDRLSVLHDYAGTLVAHTTANKLVRYDADAGTWTAYTGTYTPPTGQKMRFRQLAGSLYFTTNAGVYRLDEVTGTPLASGVPQGLAGTATFTTTGAHATGTVTLSGSANNVTVTVNGTAVGPTASAGSDTATATAVAAALNADATVSALVTASAATTVVTLTAVNGGTAGNAITLAASTTAGAATVSGATLSGGLEGTGWFPADSQTAYRFGWGIRNANDRIILGAPSGRMSVTNPATETLGTVNLVIPVPSWVTTDHFLQVYRADYSGGESIPAGDDMALVYEAYPTAADITAESMTYSDITPDELKGAFLYSSPNAGVLGSEKFQPPVCVDLAEFSGRMWCAATVQRQRLLLTLLSVDSGSGGLAASEGLTFTLGGTSETYQCHATEDAATNTFQLASAGTASQNVTNTARSLARVISSQSAFMSAFYVSGEYDNPGQVVIEAKDLGADAITVEVLGSPRPWIPALPNEFAVLDSPAAVERVSGVVLVFTDLRHGLAVGQTVELVSVSDPTDAANFPTGVKTVSEVISETRFRYIEAGADAASVSDLFLFRSTTPTITTDPTSEPHGLAYSEFGEPDAIPLANYLTAGSENYDVLRAISLGNSLFVWKEDGLFLVSGQDPLNFRVDPYPSPLKLLAPQSAVVLGSSIFALTDQGVVATTENGFQIISRQIEDTLTPLYAGSATMRATLSSVAFAVANETEREYWLFLPTLSTETYATQAYVYNTLTRAWTRWTLEATHGYVLPGADAAYLGAVDGNNARVERKTRTAADYQDADGVAIPLAVDWVVRTGGNAGANKRWQKVTALVEAPSLTNVTLSLGTELSSSRASGVMPTNGLPYVSSYIPVDQSLSQTLIVGVSGGEAGKRLSLVGLSVDYSVVGTHLR